MINNLSNIYALWYNIKTGEKSTNIISFNKDSLIELKNIASNGKDAYYNKYINSILSMEVEPIFIYEYKNNSILKLDDLTELMGKKKDGNFYASYDYYFQVEKNVNISYTDLREVLVFMSLEDHDNWRNCSSPDKDNLVHKKNTEYPDFFYEAPISLNPIHTDFFYKEGILNA